MSQNETWFYTSRRPEATVRLARGLASLAQKNTVIGLVGDLGMGKTRFVHGFAQGVGVYDGAEVVSPTYTIVNEYPCEMGKLVHIDFYRLMDSESACGLGVEECLLREEGPVLVEWADRFRDLLPVHTVWLRFQRLGPRERIIEVRGIVCPPRLRSVRLASVP